MYDLDIGVIIPLEELLEHGTKDLDELGLNMCQVNAWHIENLTKENAEKLKKITKDKIKICSLWVGWPGPRVWDFVEGPATLGLVPKEFRYVRMEALKQGAKFAKEIGVKDIVTHVGFIPENPSTSEYLETVTSIRYVAREAKKLGIYFNFETGQETPITLLRTIEDVGLDNLGINLDPANLLMYGKANPVDAVDLYKGLIRSVHVKDGKYPTNGRDLGEETPVGEGSVNFPLLLEKLISYNYKGPLIIEREITGHEQKKDILKAKELLLDILNKY
ncbi:MAG TPA: sugar phosphate isomerase/epimerase family protein [Defluviitoga sp.]|nr:sugar phosphate isomerase/epimerase family protein [Defluviitoga sp.]HOP23753.1 sugar phosphate isomerase/epimerase family protein [Defluviitoga sp.]HPZ28500.1 sugar phosphate isomerase/epimerase family protein [Defluviitoga sp.]HQD62766.1 sugar phosphate isomerase/epimerase family protein [Defluviitoga sp.]